MVTLTSTEAENDFGRLLDTAQREPVAITRDGQTAAYLISPEDMDDLQIVKQSRRSTASEEYRVWREKYRNQISPEAAKLTDEDVVRMVHEARDEITRGL